MFSSAKIVANQSISSSQRYETKAKYAC